MRAVVIPMILCASMLACGDEKSASSPEATPDTSAEDTTVADTSAEDTTVADTAEPPPAPPVFFQSGFEAGVTAGEQGLSSCSGDIQGSDGSEAGDWSTDLEQSPFDSAQFCFGGADDCALEGQPSCQRTIELVPDPENPDNTVLYTWVKEPAENYNDGDADDVPCSCQGGVDTLGNVCDDSLGDGYDNNGTRKARVQLTIDTVDGEAASQLTYSVRLRLGEAFAKINADLDLPVNWMTIGEFWNQGTQHIKMGDRSRVTLNLVKETGGGAFHFGLKADSQPDGESGWSPLWGEDTGEHLVSEMKAPVGEWFTLRVHLVAGDASNGRVTVDLIDKDGEETTLFDVTDATIFPGTDVLGFTAINPIKLYTGGSLMCWLKGLPAPLPLAAWWDDLVLTL